MNDAVETLKGVLEQINEHAGGDLLGALTELDPTRRHGRIEKLGYNVLCMLVEQMIRVSEENVAAAAVVLVSIANSNFVLDVICREGIEVVDWLLDRISGYSVDNIIATSCVELLESIALFRMEVITTIQQDRLIDIFVGSIADADHMRLRLFATMVKAPGYARKSVQSRENVISLYASLINHLNGSLEEALYSLLTLERLALNEPLAVQLFNSDTVLKMLMLSFRILTSTSPQMQMKTRFGSVTLLRELTASQQVLSLLEMYDEDIKVGLTDSIQACSLMPAVSRPVLELLSYFTSTTPLRFKAFIHVLDTSNLNVLIELPRDDTETIVLVVRSIRQALTTWADCDARNRDVDEELAFVLLERFRSFVDRSAEVARLLRTISMLSSTSIRKHIAHQLDFDDMATIISSALDEEDAYAALPILSLSASLHCESAPAHLFVQAAIHDNGVLHLVARALQHAYDANLVQDAVIFLSIAVPLVSKRPLLGALELGETLYHSNRSIARDVEGAIERAGAATKGMRTLQRMVERSEDRMRALESSRDQLIDRTEREKKAREEEWSNEKKTYVERLEDLQQTVKVQQEDIDSSQATLERLQAHILAVERDRDKQYHQLLQARKRIEELVNHCSELTNHIEILGEDRNRLQESIETLRQKDQRLGGENLSLEKQLMELKDSNSKSELKVDEVYRKLHVLLTVYESSQLKIGDLNTELRSVQHQLSVRQQTIEDMEPRLAAALKEVASAHTEVRKLAHLKSLIHSLSGGEVDPVENRDEEEVPSSQGE